MEILIIPVIMIVLNGTRKIVSKEQLTKITFKSIKIDTIIRYFVAAGTN